MLLLGSSGHRCPTVRAASPSFSSLTSSCQGLGVQGAGGRGQLRDTPAPEGLVPSALPMTRTQGAHTIPYQRCTPPNPSPVAPCPSPPAQSWALPHSHGSCPGVLGESARLAAPPGPPWVSVLLALLSHQEPDREEQRVESGGSPQPSSSLWGH